jgi:hypothetical protein
MTAGLTGSSRAPGHRQRQGEHTLQLGRVAEHLLDEGDQLRLAAPVEGGIKLLDLDERDRTRLPGEEQGCCMFAVAAIADGARTLSVLDSARIQGGADVVGRWARAGAERLQGHPLPPPVRDRALMEVLPAPGIAALVKARLDDGIGEFRQRASPGDGRRASRWLDLMQHLLQTWHNITSLTRRL